MDTIENAPAAPRRGRTVALVAAGLVSGVVLAGFATASAQTPTPSPNDDTETAAPAPKRGPGGPGKHHGRGGRGMGIHGEFVTAAPGGGYQTVATQKGEVTAVSATSITVRSEDGFSRAYAVNDDTLVNAGDDGIADVTTGDDVRVTALVADGKATAVDIHDGTKVERSRGRWAPPPREREGGPAPSGTASADA